MDFNELKTTITENESKNILNMFETLLKEQPNYLKDERSSSVKETINQACFISLGLDGVADGIFFPNAQFDFIHMKMTNFICLCIYKNKPAICYTYEKMEGYFIEYLEDIIFLSEEMITRKRLTRQHEENINCIKLLQSIKRVKKSDQSDYKIINKNFTSSLDYFTMKIDYNVIQISAIERLKNDTSKYYSDKLYIKDYQNMNDQINADSIMSTINEYITTYIEQNKTIEAKLKCLHQEALKVEKLFNDLLASSNNLLNKELLCEYIKANSYKLNK